MHLLDRTRGLEVQASAVERQALADQRNELVAIAATAVLEHQQPRLPASALSDGRQHSKALGLQIRRAANDRQRQAVARESGDALCLALEEVGIGDVGSLVAEVARVQRALRDRERLVHHVLELVAPGSERRRQQELELSLLVLDGAVGFLRSREVLAEAVARQRRSLGGHTHSMLRLQRRTRSGRLLLLLLCHPSVQRQHGRRRLEALQRCGSRHDRRAQCRLGGGLRSARAALLHERRLSAVERLERLLIACARWSARVGRHSHQQHSRWRAALVARERLLERLCRGAAAAAAAGRAVHDGSLVGLGVKVLTQQRRRRLVDTEARRQ